MLFQTGRYELYCLFYLASSGKYMYKKWDQILNFEICFSITNFLREIKQYSDFFAVVRKKKNPKKKNWQQLRKSLENYFFDPQNWSKTFQTRMSIWK